MTASQPEAAPRTVAITGASGLIGTALTQALTGRGDQVIHLVRRAPRASSGEGIREIEWSPGDELDPAALTGVDAVVNLAGAGIGEKRWTESRRAELVDSRIDSTTTISRAIAGVEGPKPRLLSGSAVGYYGDRGEELLDEESAPGDGFLADLCVDWESATAPASEAGADVVHLRTGLALTADGGALGPLLPLARLGLAGPLGSGRQLWPWITLHDYVRAVLHLLDHPDITGPVNMTGPAPVPQKAVVKALGRALHRPALLPAPSLALRVVMGDMAGEMILAGQRARPVVLEDTGFAWDHPDVDTAAAWVADQL
ncbi:TIGR01777 family oxidoreductase [Ornithinimicrobium sp. Y1694]|uniref:TIGR01777 family oxidoreductase n=1 Tax=Ornithinimicrobium sp. Y1694 TaxID=3418590 RepID=UPI003CF632D2